MEAWIEIRVRCRGRARALVERHGIPLEAWLGRLARRELAALDRAAAAAEARPQPSGGWQAWRDELL